MDDTFYWSVCEFNRVFNGQYMFCPGLVYVLEHRRQGCGFAGAGGACYENQPFGHVAHFLHNRR